MINDIITRLYDNKELNECLSKIVDIQYRQDFKQELFLILLGKPDQVIKADSKGQLIYYVVRIILNLSRQKRNVFHKKYILATTTFCTDSLINHAEENHIEEKREQEEKENKLLREVRELDKHFGTFYYRELINLIAREGGMRKAGRKIGIPVASISKAVKRVRDHLNEIVK